MSDQVDLRIGLSATSWEYRYPEAKVYIDDILIFDNQVTDKQDIEWSGELVEGSHKLIIELHNKLDSDTVTDDDGNIINDVLLNIDEVEIDNIELEYLKYSCGIYYPNNPNAPDKLDHCVNLGWNGKWELEFTAPTYLWFLENL